MSTKKDEMIAFLKKYSPVENAFVDDFFGHVDPDAPDDLPSIDLDKVSSWLNVRKGNLLKTLKASYKPGDDFTIAKPSVSVAGRGKNTRRIVTLTPDCFKMLCMQSRSPQSDRVRSYFIAVEKTLFRYRAEIMESMERRIKQLEMNQKPIAATMKQTGLVYVIRTGEQMTANKIGRTKNIVERVKLGSTGNFTNRLRSHGSARGDALDVLYLYKTEDMVAVEACAKGALKGKQYRKYKEVYEASLDVIKDVIEGCGKLVTRVQKRSKPVNGGNANANANANTKTFIIFA